MQQNDNKNTMAFIAVAFVILIGYQFLVLGPQQKRAQAELQAKKAAEAQTAAKAGVTLDASGNPAPMRLSRDAAKAQSPRIAVDTPSLSGSIALKGARIDDLLLRKYAETTDKGSPPVELFRPEGAEHAWFADFGWRQCRRVYVRRYHGR